MSAMLWARGEKRREEERRGEKGRVRQRTLDRHIPHRNQVKQGGEMTAVLEGKVAPPPGDALMDTSDHLPAFGPSWRAHRRLGQAT
jgi:hypothetical protein